MGYPIRHAIGVGIIAVLKGEVGEKKRRDSHLLTGYADADGSVVEDPHAISGYTFILNGGVISWSAEKQEISYLQQRVSTLLLMQPTTQFSDNQSAIALAKDHQYHARTKHMDVPFHFICWIMDEGNLCLVYCPTDDMVADTFTKALPSTKVRHFASDLRLTPVTGGVLELITQMCVQSSIHQQILASVQYSPSEYFLYTEYLFSH